MCEGLCRIGSKLQRAHPSPPPPLRFRLRCTTTRSWRDKLTLCRPASQSPRGEGIKNSVSMRPEHFFIFLVVLLCSFLIFYDLYRYCFFEEASAMRLIPLGVRCGRHRRGLAQFRGPNRTDGTYETNGTHGTYRNNMRPAFR